MDPIAPPPTFLNTLREFVRAGFAYSRVKEIGVAAGWKLSDDEPDLGYVAFEACLDPASKPTTRRVCVGISGSNLVAVFCPLFYFDESNQTRAPFDQAFDGISQQLARVLGKPTKTGQYEYPHRKQWPYAYACWQAGDASIALVQDEMDILFGMDVTLWLMAADTPIDPPIKYE